MCLNCGCDREFVGTPTGMGKLDGKPTATPEGSYTGVGGTKTK